MFEIILATHGNLSDGLKDACQVIMGPVDHVHTLNLKNGEDVNHLAKDMLALMDRFGREKEVLFLTDLANASPYNQSLLAINQLEKVEQKNKMVVAGANLAILIQAISEQMSESCLEESLPQILGEGREAIRLWSIASMEAGDEDEDDF